MYQLCFNFTLVLITVVNGLETKAVAPSNWRHKKARQRRAHAFLFNLFVCAIFHILNIIMSFRKPCHKPFRKLIPPFTLTVLVWSFLEFSEGSFFDHEPQISVSSTAPKLKIQPKYSWHERGYFIRDIISPSGVNKSDKKQASSEFTHASPFLIIIFF